MASLLLEPGANAVETGAEEQDVVLPQILRRAWSAAPREVRRRGDEEPAHSSEAPRDERRIGERAGADAEVESFLDEVHGAGRGEELDAHVGEALKVVGAERSE